MADDSYEQPSSNVVQMPRRSAALVAPATLLLGVANIIVFVAMVLKSSAGAVWEPSTTTLVSWGANFGPMTAGGQPWRLLTSMFLHVGVIHIFVNMYSLYNVGPVTECYFGSARFLLLYFIAGIGGSCVSMLWHPNIVSAGASGAIFGILGGMLAFITLLKRMQSNPQLTQIQLSILKVIGLNVFIGLTIPNVDNGAHLGGLVFGTFTGLALAPLQSRTARVSSGARALLGVSLILLLLFGTGFVAMRRIQAAPAAVTKRTMTDAEENWVEAIAPMVQTQSAMIGQLEILAPHVQAGTSPTGKDKAQAHEEQARLAASLVKRADASLVEIKALETPSAAAARTHALLIERGAHISQAAHALENSINGDANALRQYTRELQALNDMEEP